MTIALGRIGIWSSELRFGDRQRALVEAAKLEELGYGTLWIPGGVGGDVFGDVSALLRATEHVTVATGIVNVWMHEAADVAAAHDVIRSAHPGRFMLGLGISHGPLVNAHGGRYERPLENMIKYLDALDTAIPPVPVDERIVAALGPRMLELARDRSAGAHPYLVTAEHTARARAVLGGGPVLAPEQAAVLESDAAVARAIGRKHLQHYLLLPNYTGNFLRFGYTPEDLENGGSDRLIDGLVAWGDEAAILARVQAHWDAGADHVCLQVLPRAGETMPSEQWRALAAVFEGA
jgi:probable F420-dependent oxidoreductase